MSDSVGDRVRAIREARGEKQPEFAAALTAAARRLGITETYDNTMVSKMEVGRRDVGLIDAAVIASLDPSERGRSWLAWGDQAEQATVPKHKPGERVPKHDITPHGRVGKQ